MIGLPVALAALAAPSNGLAEQFTNCTTRIAGGITLGRWKICEAGVRRQFNLRR